MNPETVKLRQRIKEYKHTHKYTPTLTDTPERIRRKKRYTKRKFTGKETCYYCGRKLTRATATFDHVVPLSQGGADEFYNLVWCCRRCNSSKGSKTLEEWRKEEK